MAQMPTTLLRDKPDPDAWKSVPTWDDTPVMPPSCKPLSFFARSPLLNQRPKATADGEDKIEPMSLPPAKYVVPEVKVVEDPLAHMTEWIDGRRHLWIDGVLLPTTYEKHPGPQSIYPPAIPSPGVSKKSRGRRVPTKDMGVRTGTTYTCKVEGCRKVFIRSEHLKRHVRSLHTLEKRYFCALPFCDKAFARRDNMLQHERKHKDYQAFFDCSSGDYNGIKQIEHHPDPEPMPEDPDGEPWWTKLYLPFTPDNPPILRAPIFDNAQGFSSAASQPPPTGGFFTFSAHAPTM